MDAHVAAQLTLAERREKLGKRHLHALQRQTYYLRLSLQPPVSHEVLPSLATAEQAEGRLTQEGLRLELELTLRAAAQLKLKLKNLQEDHEHMRVRFGALTAQHAWETRAAAAAHVQLMAAIASLHEQQSALAMSRESIESLQERLLGEGTERSRLQAALQRERTAAEETACEQAARNAVQAQALSTARTEADLQVRQRELAEQRAASSAERAELAEQRLQQRTELDMERLKFADDRRAMWEQLSEERLATAEERGALQAQVLREELAAVRLQLAAECDRRAAAEQRVADATGRELRELHTQLADKDRRIAALEDACRAGEPTGTPAHVVRAAVGVVGSIVAGLPPSAKKLQGDAAVHRAGLAVIAEAEPDAAETAQQPGSESMLPADEAAVQSGQGAGHAAGSLQHGPSRKRSSHSLPLEPVPEHAEKVKRPKHASSATEGDTVSLRGSPPKVVALEKGGGKAKTARAAAASHEDVAAVKPTQGPAVAGRPTRQRSKPAAFWLPSGAEASAGAPTYREVSASPSPCEPTDAAEEAATDPAADVDPSNGRDASGGADDAAMEAEPPQQPAPPQDVTGRDYEDALADGARPAMEQPALKNEPKERTAAVPALAVPPAQPAVDCGHRQPQRPQGVAKVDLSTAFSAASAPRRPEPGPAQQVGRRGSAAGGSQPAAPSRLAKSSSAAAGPGVTEAAAPASTGKTAGHESMLARDPLSALNSSVIEAARARPTDADVAIKAASQKTWSKLGVAPGKRKLSGKPSAGIHGKAIPNDLLFGAAMQIPKVLARR